MVGNTIIHKCCWIIAIFISLISCNQESKTKDISENSEFDITIEHLPGDNFSYDTGEINIPYLAYPFHVGYIKGQKSDDLKCILLSKKLSARRSVRIRIIASFRFIEFGLEKTYIVAVPKEENLASIQINDFKDFVTKQSSVRQIIETWLMNQCGSLGCAKKIGWENESAALHYLEKNNNQK